MEQNFEKWEQLQRLEKLKKRIEELRVRSVIVVTRIPSFLAIEEDRDPGKIYHEPPEKEGYSLELGKLWGSEDGYVWLGCDVMIPTARKGYESIGFFDFDSIHEGYASGFESMFFLNGKPYQGVDENHRLICLGNYEGKKLKLTFQLWMGITGGPKSTIYHQIKEAYVGYLHKKTEQFAILAEMVLEQAKTFPEWDAKSLALMKLLDSCIRPIAWEAGEDVFRDSIETAYEKLTQGLLQYPEKALFTIHCIGHTHIDLAWMWQIQHTKEKAMRSFSTVMRLLEEFPDFRFYHSTPQIYEYIKEESKELYEEIKIAIDKGRWEAGGAMWVEADCNLPSGESLVRQILYGKQFFNEEFGVDTRFVWLPDAFGFSHNLPQILKKSGIDFFLTSKISWNKQNRFPHDTFAWRGPDGSEITAYFLTTPCYGFPTQEWAVTYNGDITPKVLNGTYELYQEKRLNEELMLTYGYGDGGGGCTREMILKIEAMKKIPFAPNVKFTQPTVFFEKLEKNLNYAVKSGKTIPVWDGELYLEYHRGTYTSQGFVKKSNRYLERALRCLEFLNVWKGIITGKMNFEAKELASLWKVLLKNQFHDIIPGSSISEVYEDAKMDYDWLEVEIDQRMTRFEGNENQVVTIVNTGSWERGQIVSLPKLKPFERWTLEDGTILPWALGSGRSCLVEIQTIAPFNSIRVQRQSIETVEKLDRKCDQNLSMISMVNEGEDGGLLESNKWILLWNKEGMIERLYDKELCFEVFCEGVGNQLVIYEDKPLMFDAWDIDSYYKEKSWNPTFKGAELIENTGLQTRIRFTYEFRNSLIWQDVIIQARSGQLTFETKVDWKERHCLFKTYFPINVRTKEAVYDTQFGIIKRSTCENTCVEQAMFEVCGHRFVDVSQRDRGVSILNDCKYGHDVKGSTIGLTLLKSSVEPDDRADQGIHTFSYGIYPHKGDWYEGETVKEAFSFNEPFLVLKGDSLSKRGPILEFHESHVEVDAIKGAEDGNGIILRFHEFGGTDEKITITSPCKIKYYCECNLMEDPVEPWMESASLEIKIHPYEIKTYRIIFGN